MADKKISQLTELTTAADDDSLVILDKDADVTKRIEVSNLVGTNELLLKTAGTLSSSPQAVQSVGDQVSALQISSVGVKASGTLTATGDSTLTNATLSGDLTLASGSSVNAIHDSDTLSEDSDTALATQQSIKAYVDAVPEGTVTSVDVSGGTTGLTASGGPITSSGTVTLGGTVATTNGGTGLTVIGGAGQVLTVNSGATGLEYTTVSGAGTVTSVGISGSDGIDVDSGSPITTTGTIALGLSNVPNASLAYSSVSLGGVSVDLGGSDATPAFDLRDATHYEGTSLNSTGETGGTKFLREDGDGTCSWQPAPFTGTVTSVSTAGTVSGLTLTGGPITSTGTVTLGGTLSADLTSDVTGTLPVGNGGTGVASFAIGDIIYASGATTLSKLAKGTSGQVLKMNSGETAPEWATDSDSGGTVTSVTAGSDSGSTTAITTSGTITFEGGTNVTTSATGSTVTINSTDQYDGTVTSVTAGSDSGSTSAITGSGTITFEGGTNVTTSATGSTVTINSTDQYDGTVTSITPAADAGSGTAITATGTLTNTGGTGIDTSVSGTTTTFDLDLNELTDLTNTTFGTANFGAGDHIAVADASDSNLPKKVKFPVDIGLACSDETTALTASTTTPKLTFRMPHAMTLTEVRASVTTAPTGAEITVDIHDSGTTIMDTTKLSIDTGEKTSTSSEFPAVLSHAALDNDAEITIYVDQIGSTVAGAGLKVWLLGYR